MSTDPQYGFRGSDFVDQLNVLSVVKKDCATEIAECVVSAPCPFFLIIFVVCYNCQHYGTLPAVPNFHL